MDRVIRIQTSRGMDAIFYAGYSYRFDRRAANGDIQWRCLRDACYGRLRTDVDYNQPTIFGNPHVHPSNAEDGVIRATLTRMRERAATESTSIPQIYQEEANRLAGSASTSAMLPILQSIDSSLHRARRSHLPAQVWKTQKQCQSYYGNFCGYNTKQTKFTQPSNVYSISECTACIFR
ncbi:hypothetical protein R1sor_009445 [Riccia sorocarpa]|uniref:FLYWCH-type domain-containing protein n=1 Tax=Riccia sorocarpa TaxID=122646 RepID=A0ABD3HYH4_9MARC